MLPLFDRDVDRAVERATAALDRFPNLFEHHWLDGMRAKLGLFTQEDRDKALVDDMLSTPYDHGPDWPMFSTPSTSNSGERPYRTFWGT